MNWQSSERRWPLAVTSIALAVELVVFVALILLPGSGASCDRVFEKWFCEAIVTPNAAPIAQVLSLGPPIALLSSVIGSWGRHQTPWRADSITGAVVFWVAVIMAIIDAALHALGFLISAADWH